MLQIIYLKSIDSTQRYLKQELQCKHLQAPIAIVADMQTAGMGSRENSWTSQEGNLFLSFALPQEELPSDLPLASASLYFATIMKEVLREYGSDVWIKWPNDFYCKSSKTGGMITHIVAKNIICGLGLNLKNAPNGFAVLDIDIQRDVLVENYLKKIEEKPLWKQVFSKYKLEFYKNRGFFTHKNSERLSFDDALLQEDGSLEINGERIYSLR